MIKKHEYRRQSDVLRHIVLVASLFSAFGLLSYQIGLNSADTADRIDQIVAENKADSRNEAAPAYFGAKPALLTQWMNESAMTYQINYSDTGE